MPSYPLHEALAAFHGYYPEFRLEGAVARDIEHLFGDRTGHDTAPFMDAMIQRSAAIWAHARALSLVLDLPPHVVHTILGQVIDAHRDGKGVDEILDFLNTRRVHGSDKWSAESVLRIACTVDLGEVPEVPPPPKAIS